MVELIVTRGRERERLLFSIYSEKLSISNRLEDNDNWLDGANHPKSCFDTFISYSHSLKFYLTFFSLTILAKCLCEKSSFVGEDIFIILERVEL